VPCVILGRIRRTADLQLVLIDALLLYAAFLVSAFWLDQKFLHSDRSLIKLFVAALLTLFGELLSLAWRNSSWRIGPVPVFMSTAANALMFWSIPAQVLLFGWLSGLLLTASVRAVLPSEKMYPSPMSFPTPSSSIAPSQARKIGGFGLITAFCLIVFATEGLRVGLTALVIGILAIVIGSFQKG
jgi:hypothetical protein